MGVTQLNTAQVKDGTISRDDLDITTVGKAVVRKIIAGTNITITETGVDAGTGDVTINATAGGGTNIGNTNLVLSGNRWLDLRGNNFEISNTGTESGIYIDYTNNRTTLGDKVANSSASVFDLQPNQAYISNSDTTMKFGINQPLPTVAFDLFGGAKMFLDNSSNGAGKFLQDVDGAGNLEFADVPTYVGAGAGLVPPTSGGLGDFYLKQDGTWSTVSGGGGLTYQEVLRYKTILNNI